MMPPEKMAQIGVAMATAIASAIKENPNDNVCVHRALWDGTHARIAWHAQKQRSARGWSPNTDLW